MDIRSLALAAVVAVCVTGCNQTTSTVAPVAAAPAKVIQDGTLMTPGTPQLTAIPGTVSVKDKMLPVEWNMWWGENGKHWSVYVDGIEVSSGELKLESPKSQQGKIEVELGHPGEHEIKVALCNDHGCTESAPVAVNVVPDSSNA